MKESYWGYWLIVLGIFIVVIMSLTNSATTTNTQDYYQLKEVANSALYDAIDYSYFTKTKQVRIYKEVFVENFLRRFAETITPTESYKIEFFDLFEAPPKVSVKVSTETAGFLIGRDTTSNNKDTKDEDVFKDDDTEMVSDENGTTSLDIVNSIDLIIEFDTSKGPLSEGGPNTDNSCAYYPGSKKA